MTPREQQLEAALAGILDAIWQSRLWAEPNYPREVHEAVLVAGELLNNRKWTEWAKEHGLDRIPPVRSSDGR